MVSTRDLITNLPVCMDMHSSNSNLIFITLNSPSNQNINRNVVYSWLLVHNIVLSLCVLYNTLSLPAIILLLSSKLQLLI